MKRSLFLLIAWSAYGVLAAQTPTVAAGGVLNGASFLKGGAITPGSLITIFGTQLASKTAEADTIPLSTALGGVTVQFVNGSTTVNAPMLFANSSQVNAQVPWELVPNGTTAPVSVNVIVSNNGVASVPAAVTVGPFSPGIFSSNGLAIAENQDGTLAWPTGAVAGLTTHPAKPGDVIIIYATGLGAVNSPITDGQNSLDKLRNTLTVPVVMIGGVTAQVEFSGLSPQFVGVNQLNVVVPNTAAGDSVPLQLFVGGITTSNTITMAVANP
jgi:uncharacterized protein (TIGR03437 family)